jgi:hypothetical protein
VIDPIEAVGKAREGIIQADANMKPGEARPGPALACLANAVQALADGVEALAVRDHGEEPERS